ncbi:hypothetical protein RvY_10308, partial [Ramazzottius varieornatus]
MAVENNLLHEHYDKLSSQRLKQHFGDEDYANGEYDSPSHKKVRLILRPKTFRFPKVSEPLLRLLADRFAFVPFHFLLTGSRN